MTIFNPTHNPSLASVQSSQSLENPWDDLLCTEWKMDRFEGVIPQADMCYDAHGAEMILTLGTGIGKIRKRFNITHASEEVWEPLPILRTTLKVQPLQLTEDAFQVGLSLRLGVKQSDWHEKVYTQECVLARHLMDYTSMSEADLQFLWSVKG